MEFKGTKGKWEINPRASRNVRCGLITIANCSSGQNGELEEEEKANALLISKSPILLDAIYKSIEPLRNVGLKEMADYHEKIYFESIKL